MNYKNKPRFDHFSDSWVLVNGAIVHDDNGVGRGVRIHLLQKVLDKRHEEFGIERTFDDEALDHAVHRNRREDRVSMRALDYTGGRVKRY